MTAESLLISIDVPVNVSMGKVAHRPSGCEGKAHGKRVFRSLELLAASDGYTVVYGTVYRKTMGCNTY
jgi:hypothetical protein